MKDLAIDRIEVFTVGPPTRRLAWALEMPAQFMTETILKLTTHGGLTGIAGAVSYADFGYESSVAEALRPLLPHLIGRHPLAREAVWQDLLSRTLPRAPQAQSLIDIALWDLAAKAAGVPLWQFLGGARDRIAAYASTALLDSAEAYVDEVVRLRAEGFRAIKFHCWCEPGRDLAMVRKVSASGQAEGLALMLDVEQRYTPDAALRVGYVLGELGYDWFEAPLDDFDLDGYRRLAAALAVPIVPAGNSVLDNRLIGFAAARDCWDKMRVDVTMCGGFTPALKIMGLAASLGRTVELQCWGYTLTQAANLHLMLGQPNCTWFEQPLPYDSFEFGAQQVIRTDREGFVHAPPGHGLGIELDWEAIGSATLGRIECSGRTA
ncbi:MAG TPA: mandelate racemase/muconate lactonizing enzyme family protein [Acetobacteraceae bacterium]|nr:mandelate racemase/muconate lactonizing enzyme family protein [Acetobacteraceae bacterium]